MQPESDLGTTGGSASLQADPGAATNLDQMSIDNEQLGLPLSLNPFDMMNTYLAPDIEASGLFYPDWMWDENLTGAP